MDVIELPLEPFIIFKALSGETRIKIIEILKSKGPLGSKEIAETLGVTPAAISQHLKILKHSGILKSERQGFWIPYSIDEIALEHCRQIIEHVCSCHVPPQKPAKRGEDDLDELQEYKTRLERELNSISEKIETLKSRK